MKLFLIAGARPNFMKIAPIVRALRMHREQMSEVGCRMSEIRGRERTEVGDRISDVGGGQKKEDGGQMSEIRDRMPEVGGQRSEVGEQISQIEWKIVHTGQHYDYEMSQTFFDDLEIPKPDFFLDAGSGSHAEQTARIMISFEKVCERERPDIVVVVGDVNSTLACSIVAKKLLIEVAHVEAGLRSFDLSMPEEINRMVTDSITDYFFVTEKQGRKNLLKEGKSEERIFFVGHVMIDNLLYQLQKVEKEVPAVFETSRLKDELGKYCFLTLHRPSNVDSREALAGIVEALNSIAQSTPIIFPVHPRTRKMLEQFNLELCDRIFQLPPLGFKESLFLWKDAQLVMTDSGGLQEETTGLGVPCFTIRENTERPITIEKGTNILVGPGKEGIITAYDRFQKGERKAGKVPELWDGKAAERIVDILERI